jgi:hypothetical protein
LLFSPCRVEVRRGSLGRSLFSPVSPPFRLRVSHHLDHAPSPHPAQRTGRAELRHPALGQGSPARDPLRRVGRRSVMASEASEPLNGVDRLAPISRLSAPSTMGLELGSLPSTGATRLRNPSATPMVWPGPRGRPVEFTRLAARSFPYCVGSPCAGMPPPITLWDLWSVSRREGSTSASKDGGLPRIATGSASASGCFGACTLFTCVAACLLAEPPERPVVSKASTALSPPPPLR